MSAADPAHSVPAGLPLPPAPAMTAAVTAILAAIEAVPLRARIDATVRYALAALQEFEAVHLPQDEFEEQQGAGSFTQHLELAPQVLAAVAASNQLLAYLMANFTPPPEAAGTDDADFDLAFDLVDGPTGDSVGLAAPRPLGAASQDLGHRADEAAHAFGGMLRGRLCQFGERLAFALQQQQDPWRLLAELDDYKHRLSKAVQGVLFGILGVFAEVVRREDILPAYRSAVREAVQLRSAVADLSHHTGRCNAALARAEAAQAVPLMVALADRLHRFCARPAYRTLRAEDKRALIEFRRALFGMRQQAGGPTLVVLRQQVEGFAKFLESMQAINHREVLAVHDRLRLQEALDLLRHAATLADPAVACTELDTAVSALAAVQGRSPELDAARRDYIPVAVAEVGLALTHWQGQIASVIAGL